ncbi:MAG: chemotaxis protein CheW [Sphingobium sp.]
MSGLYLFARISGTAVAIATDEVEAVVRLRELSPVPGVPPHVAGLSALRSRVLTIIDAPVLICGRPTQSDTAEEGDRYAIMCDISGHSYGILVDGVDDIQTLDAVPMPICGKVDAAWLPYAAGVIDFDGRPHFVLSVASFVEGCMAAQAA